MTSVVAPSLPQSLRQDPSLAGEAHSVASFVCLFGVLMRIIMSEPILGMMGIDYYGTESGSFLSKIHPGSYLVLLSLFILLTDRGQFVRQGMQIFRANRVFSLLFLFDVLMFIYWTLRGPSGVGMLIDTHMTVPAAAIVLSYAPRSHCRNYIRVFIGCIVLNSFLGIAESLGRFRVMPFDADWPILKEEHFRASALFGHPLNNATLTCVAVTILLALRSSAFVKGSALMLLLVSLVAFGGRSALLFSLLCASAYGVKAFIYSCRKMTILKLCSLLAAAILVPAVLFGCLYFALTSSMGERLLAFSSLNDSSAAARSIVLSVFNVMSKEEILFGIDVVRIQQVGEQIGLKSPMADIENPWVLMSLQLGMLFFPVWLAVTFAFVRKLMQDKSFALCLAVVAYFVTASTFNSFGRKDALYTIMVAAVLCVYRGFDQKWEQGANNPLS